MISISPADRGRCAACPVAAGLSCAGLRRPAYCGRAAEGRPEWLARIVEASAEDFRPEAAPPTATAAAPAPARTVPLAELFKLEARRKACPKLGPKAACGCSDLWTCLAGRGRSPGGGPGPDVTRADCYACPELPPAIA